MGQGGVGKTAMVLRYTTGDFNEQVSIVLYLNSIHIIDYPLYN